MQADALERENAVLRRQVAQLTEENQQLIDRAEDILLLGTVAERTAQEKTLRGILGSALEVIASLKDADYCAFASRDGHDLRILQQVVAPNLAPPIGHELRLAASTATELGAGRYLMGCELADHLIVPGAGPPPWSGCFVLLPLELGAAPSALLCVMRRSNEAAMELLQPVLARICDLVAARARELALTEQLRAMNDSLEERANQRTSELERMVASLREAEHRQSLFRDLLDQSTDAVFMVDADSGRILLFNQRAMVSLGYTEDELKQLTVADVDPIVNNQDTWRTVAEQLRKMPAPVLHLGTHRRKDGSTFPVEVHTRYVQVHDRPYFISAVRDITERKRLDDLRDEFLAVAAHELKTPLTLIKTYVQLLQRWAPEGHNPREKTAFMVLNRQSDRMNRLVRDLLQLSRTRLGGLDLILSSIDLAELANRAVDKLQHSGVRHRLLRHIEAHPHVVGDADRLEQVIANLLDNAIRYSPTGGDIELTVAARDGEALLEVRDHGIGIPAAAQPRIFERFFRAHAGTPSDYGGLGVGLHVSRSIVEGHRGRIWFDSAEGSGSTFHVSLPSAEERGHAS